MKKLGVFLGVAPHAGGMFQYARSLLDGLRAVNPEEYSVHVVCANPGWEALLAEYPYTFSVSPSGTLGIRLSEALMALRIPARPAQAISRIFNPVVQHLRRQRCDAWIFPAQDALTYQTGLPAIATVHDLMHRYEPHFPEVSSKSRFALREHRFRNIVHESRAILVDSDTGKQHVVASYGADARKIFPLPYIPPRYIYEGAAQENDAVARHGLQKKYLFYPAQFWAHKNHRRLIDAAAAVRADCPDIHLVFTGGKRYGYEDVAAHAAALGMQNHVTFAGYVPDRDLPAFYRHARAMVMPTFFGPTNIPPLEAMACGCPVAVSGIYGMPEQLGDAALYFDPTSVDDIAQAVRRLWLDDALCDTLKERGKRKLSSWGQAQFDARLKTILDTVFSR